MKKILLSSLIFLALGGLRAQETSSVPESSTSTAKSSPSGSSIPWSTWFKKNVLVKNHPKYVYFFFNIQDFKKSFAGKNKNSMLAVAASHLVADLYPKDSKVQLIKADIVFIKERDDYGMPKWDTLERVVHLEFLKTSVLESGKPLDSFTEAEIKKKFLKFQLF